MNAEDAPLLEMCLEEYIRQVSIMESMAKADKTGTEIQVRTFAHNETAVVPADEEIVNVEYDRTMSVTRVTTKRAYDQSRADKEREDRTAGSVATPTYPQPAGAVPAVEVDLTAPPTSYTWGSIDTTKVQNLEDLKKLPPPIAVQEAAQKPEEAKDETEVTGEVQEAANEDSADPAHTADKPLETEKADEVAKDREKAAKEAEKNASDSSK